MMSDFKKNTYIKMLKELVSIANELDERSLFRLSSQVEEIVKSAAPLSDVELNQLGQPHGSSSFDYIDREKWDILRDRLVSRKPSKSYIETDDFKYDPELTAYTPGETLALLSNPKIKSWFKKIEEFKIPDEYKHIILVPCAASKPWGVSCPSSGKYYKAYHDIKKNLAEDDKKAYWVTISEPLGIVPEDMWDSFPGYDVPGLFKDPSSRMSGMTTKQWKDLFGEKYSPPFDKEAYTESIKILGRVISKFIRNNLAEGRRWISFIGGTKGKVTTHSEMMTEALNFLKEDGEELEYREYTKDEDKPGHPTRDRIKGHLDNILRDELYSGTQSFLGYKVVSHKDGRLFSLQNPSIEYSGEIGSISQPLEGIFLGTSRSFATDYYSGLTDEGEAILTYEYSEDDLLSGKPEEDGEVKVGKARLIRVEALPKEF